MLSFEQSIRFLDLPRLDHSICQEIVTAAEKINPDFSSINWLENFHNNNIKAVSQIYARESAILSKSLQDKIRQQYQHYFSAPITPIFGVFENVYKDNLAECPPHCDRHRRLAINYIITSGGSNVLTCFYHNRRINQNLEVAENALHDNISLNFKVRLPDQVWHTYDVQTYHSVENIETKRIILSLYLEDNIDYKNFVNLHNHLMYE